MYTDKTEVVTLFLPIDNARLARLNAFLSTNDDCERIGEGYIMDVYDEHPFTAEIELTKGGVEILAMGFLTYSKDHDGWYMSQRDEPPYDRFSAWLSTLN